MTQAFEIFDDTETAVDPLQGRTWLLVAPCGCVDGMISAAGPERRATEDAAWEALVAGAAVRRRYRDLGYTMRLETFAEAREAIRADCEHDPKWGVPPAPVVDGYVWVTPPNPMGAGSNTRMHLVAAEGLPAAPPPAAPWKRVTVPTADLVALCGRTHRYDHRAAAFAAVQEHVHCKTCLRRAESSSAPQTPPGRVRGPSLPDTRPGGPPPHTGQDGDL